MLTIRCVLHLMSVDLFSPTPLYDLSMTLLRPWPLLKMGVIQKDWMINMLFLGQIYGLVFQFNLHLVDLYIAKAAPLPCITKI